MSRCQAKLIGESDGHTVTREFDDERHAIAWLTGAGLVDDFADQSARGETYRDGKLIWQQSGLRSPEQAKHDKLVDAHRLLAKFDLTGR
jgi:hypothetical protein